MDLPPHIKHQLESSDRATLQVIASFLLHRALENGKAASKLTETFRHQLDLFRAGRRSVAHDVVERVVLPIDEARAHEDLVDDQGISVERLASIPPQGRA